MKREGASMSGSNQQTIVIDGVAHQPDQAYDIAMTFYNAGRHDDARSVLRRLLELVGENPQILHLSALVEVKCSNFVEAEKLIRDVLKHLPDDPLAWNNCGNILQSQNKLKEAVDAYERVIQLSPVHESAYCNLAVALGKLGRTEDAISAYQKALGINPDDLDAKYNYGNTLLKINRYDDATKMYEQVLEGRPNDADCLFNLGDALHKNGQLEKAIECFDKAHATGKPGYVTALWRKLLSLPILYTTEEEVHEFHEKWIKGLDVLIKAQQEEPHEFQLELFKAIKSETNFLLHYQGADITELQKKYGRFVHKIVGDVLGSDFQNWVPAEKPAGEKIRVGFVSSYFRSNTIFDLFKGWVFGLNREKFDVYCFDIGKIQDRETDKVAAHTHYEFIRDQSIEDQVSKIREVDLDAVIFLEIGMEPLNQVLASCRLAKNQIVAYGHPVTSGIPTVDYFLSGEAMEAVDGQDHYTETLVCLPGIAIDFPLPSEVGTDSGPDKRQVKEITYLCSQSLFKLLPRDDDLFARIALGVPHAKFFFIEHFSKRVTATFWDRLCAAFRSAGLDANEYCHIHPRLSHDEFIELNKQADILLDSTNWSGGGTSLHALGLNKPIVTLPGQFMRGRYTYGMLAQMGVRELIAENKSDYVDIAVELGNDGNVYSEIQKKIEKNKKNLFDDKTAIRELEKFLESIASNDG